MEHHAQPGREKTLIKGHFWTFVYTASAVPFLDIRLYCFCCSMYSSFAEIRTHHYDNLCRGIVWKLWSSKTYQYNILWTSVCHARWGYTEEKLSLCRIMIMSFIAFVRQTTLLRNLASLALPTLFPSRYWFLNRCKCWLQCMNQTSRCYKLYA